MTDGVLNVVLGLIASAISAGLGWLAQSVRRRRRLERERAFFGLPADGEALLVVNHHPASPSSKSVSRSDVYALMELAALVRECGAQATLTGHDEVRQGLGDKTEFCVGGPSSNVRTAAHLASWLPGVAFGSPAEDSGHPVPTLLIGSREFAFETSGEQPGGRAYVLLARVHLRAGSRPVFLISGQTAVSNHAAVRYLAANHRKLARRHGRDGAFAVVLRVVNARAYGPDVVEFEADVTAAATARPSPAAV
ncbi:hypothetical protein [Streptomyces sp. TLI_171]|uniref:hypothetical protein n=1 Tax=Streptomyces sp. TLI_171 TaxID=1938859 RepID=UPI000C195F50|nr:hypothetical protein [Streptomyces sp. TLI_171]RKE19395.1 hypothetical protein BX266_2717 [Streptomyces sp. TLI_171]